VKLNLLELNMVAGVFSPCPTVESYYWSRLYL